MQQEDYILKEIEKIGKVILAIRHKIFGVKSGIEPINPKAIEESKTMMLEDLDFDLDQFLSLNRDKAMDVISKNRAFNVENMELLAGLLSDIGFSTENDRSRDYREKSLLLLEFCRISDKTYKIERELNIELLKQST